MRAICAGLLMAAAAAHGATGQPGGLQPRDINGDGVADAYYDPAANLTWAADANLAGTLGLADYPPMPGAMTWAAANAWASGLNLYGVTGWRLPRAAVPDCAGDGDPDACYVAQSNYSVEWVPTSDPFTNVMLGNGQWYWFGTLFQPAYGGPPRAVTTVGVTDELDLFGYTWAVHDGDIQQQHAQSFRIAAVPEPSTHAALATGIAALLVCRLLNRDPRRG